MRSVPIVVEFTAGRDLRAVRHSAGDEWRRMHRRRGSQRTAPLDADSPGPLARSPKLARLEAALLVADGPLSTRKLAQFAALADAREVRTLIDELNTALEAAESTFRVERVSSGYRLLTLPAFAPWLDRLHHRQAHLKLSAPMLETLAIVAYRQPVTRADLEAIRGVQCSEMLKQLMEQGLVKIVGEHDSLGRPYLYGTTRQFLELYGLTSLNQMPMAESLKRPAIAAPLADDPADEPDPSETASADDVDSKAQLTREVA